MSTCESCGATFDAPSSDPTSTLCPRCRSKRGPTRGRPVGRDEERGAEPAALSPVASRRAARQHAAELKKEEGQVTRMGWVVASGLAAITAIVLFFVLSAKNAEQRRIDEIQQSRSKLLSDLKALDLSSEGPAGQAMALIEDKKPLWEGTAIEVDVKGFKSTAMKSLETAKERKELVATLEAMEKTIQDPSRLKSSDLEDVRRKLGELQDQIAPFGSSFTDRVDTARKSLDRALVGRLLEEARATAAGPDGGRNALNQYARAEEIIAKLDSNLPAKEKDAKLWLEEQYQLAVRESDAVCAKVFDAEAIAKAPLRDLLAGDLAASWAVSEVPGFQFKIASGVLSIVGPNPDAGKQAVASVGDKDKWRDFVLELEFTLQRGHFDLFVRTGNRVDRTVKSFPFESRSYAPGESHRVQISCIGSHVTFRVEPAVVEPFEEDLSWTLSRRGAVALVIPDGTQLQITRMRVRVLR